MTQIFTEVLKGLSDEVPEKVGLGQSEGNEDRNSLTTCGKNIPGRGTSKHKGLRRPVCWSAGIGEGGWWEPEGALRLCQPLALREGEGAGVPLPGRIGRAYRPLSVTRSQATAPTSPSHLCITSGQGDEAALVDPETGRQLSQPCKIMMIRVGMI